MTETIEPIIKTRSLPLSVEAAFSLFTENMSSWWPFGTHSVGGDTVVRVDFDLERRQLIETTTDGSTSVWAQIEAWEPPALLALAWHPGRSPEEASSLEVRFEPEGAGSRVVLTHDGWGRFGDDGHRLRANYDEGWDLVLSPYLAAA